MSHKHAAALAAVMALLASAGPASAAVTTTQITTPAQDSAFTAFDQDDPATQTMTVAGTSDGTTGDKVDIRCFIPGGYTPRNVALNVPVNADGTFSTDAADTNQTWTCDLRAVPAGSPDNVSLMTFAGPVAGFGWVSKSVDGSQVYDFDIETSTRSVYNYFDSAGSCGFYYQYTYKPDWSY